MTHESNSGGTDSPDDKLTNVGARVAEYTHGIGDRIRRVRKDLELTQDEFGGRLGVTRQSVNSYETGRLLPRTPMIVKIGDLTDHNPWWLLFGIGNPSQTGSDSRVEGEQLSGPSQDLSELTETQRFLIKYIAEENKAAEHMARLLMKKAMDL